MVKASVSVAFAANIENLTLTGSAALNGTALEAAELLDVDVDYLARLLPLIRSFEEALKSRNLSFPAQDRMDNLLKAHT